MSLNNFLYNHKFVASFHTTTNKFYASHNYDLVSHLDSILQEQAYLDRFVEKHVEQVLLEITKDLKKDESDSYIVISESNSSITLSEAEAMARNIIRDAIQSGEMKPFDESDILEMLERIPEGLLDNVVEEGISALENDSDCQEELESFSRDELERYVKRS